MLLCSIVALMTAVCMLPDARDRMTAYRAEGFEVLAMIDLPEGATATDAEVNLSVALQRVPEAVAVLEGVETGVQTTRDSGRQLADILAQTGHGFVTQNSGLNTVQKLAARQGVPSAVVFRDFDGKGQTPTVSGSGGLSRRSGGRGRDAWTAPRRDDFGADALGFAGSRGAGCVGACLGRAAHARVKVLAPPVGRPPSTLRLPS